MRTVLWRIYRGKEAEIAPMQADYTRALLKTMQLVAQPELDRDALRTGGEGCARQAAEDRRHRDRNVRRNAGADFSERTTSTRRRVSSLSIAGSAKVFVPLDAYHLHRHR